MRKLRIEDLKPASGHHFLGGLTKGETISKGGLHIYKPGECAHPGGHTHEGQEVFVNLQGRGKLIVDGVEHEFKMGETVIIEPGEKHELIADENDPLVNLWFQAE